MSDVAIVTGAAAGLGAVVAARLHAAGHRVAIADVDAAGASELAGSLDRTGETATAVALDVRDGTAIAAAADLLERRWGGVQIVVNNAAVTRATPLLDIALDEWDAVMAVNARGTFAMSQVFGRCMKAAGYGRIVNLASLAGQNGGTATGAHYAASKGAILTLTKVFARDLAPHGVTVNAVAPGPLDTPAVQAIVPVERMPGFLANVPVGALGEAAFVADIVVRLAARDAGFVTGATWDVNGGLFMR